MICGRRRVVAAALSLIWLALPLRAQLLNSERIEQTFGSYGIDVVHSDPSLRISNLYSTEDGRRVTRTVAFVGYPDSVDRAFADEHRAVLAGGSIGATFKAAGWDVVKTAHSYFRVAAPAAVAAAMQIPTGTMLAAHAYQLRIVKRRRELDYALIIEIHHPAYLSEADLREIYGDEEVAGMTGAVQGLLRRGMEQFVRFGLTLSQ